MPGLPLLLVLLSSLCLAAITYQVLAAPQGRHQRRVKKRLGRLREDIRYQPEESLLRNSSGGLARLNQWLEQHWGLKSWRHLLLQADLHWQVSTLFSLLFLSAVLGAALGFLRYGPQGALAGAVLGMALPYKVLALKANAA